MVPPEREEDTIDVIMSPLKGVTMWWHWTAADNHVVDNREQHCGGWDSQELGECGGLGGQGPATIVGTRPLGRGWWLLSFQGQRPAQLKPAVPELFEEPIN